MFRLKKQVFELYMLYCYKIRKEIMDKIFKAEDNNKVMAWIDVQGLV